MKRKGLYRDKKYIPKPWDIIFCANDGRHIDHCSIVKEVNDNEIISIDGNSLDPSGIFPKGCGGAVSIRHRKFDSPVIIGYAATNIILNDNKNPSEK